MTPGKRWEKNFKDSLPGIIRLYDTTNGYTGICNPCDFIYYVYPFLYMVELKSVQDDRFDYNNISDNQHEQLDFYNHIYGTTSIVCVQFRKYKEAFVIPYEVIKHDLENNKKSMNYHDIQNYFDIKQIPLEYKTVNCKVNESEFKIILERISRKS